MHARTFLAGLATSSVAVSALALSASPALAYTPDADDTTYQSATATDLVGVGSDTTQGVVRALANSYNGGATNKVVSWSATGGGTIPVRGSSTEINRPVGSGAGKTLLYGAGNNTAIDFARSSSANSTAETSAGLQMFPFAVDTLVMAKSGLTTSNAPATLTIQQILGIYTGVYTDWSQLGGAAGTIKPYIPQSGSGTLSFFVAQLTAANGGSAPTLAKSVTSVTEHDPAPIQSDANAIAPFSAAKKFTLANPNAISTEPGFSADRAVYNVVRGADASKASVQAAFGPTGFFCSETGKSIIEQQGFRQLYPTSRDGVCGQVTQSAPAALITGNVATTTSVTVTSASAGSARITASVTGAGANPTVGTVSFYEGSTLLASGVPLTSTQAVRVQPTTPGTHTYRAVYVPKSASSAFQPSEGTGTGTVAKGTSTVSGSFTKKIKFGKKAKGTVSVSLGGTTAKASGAVTVAVKGKTVGTGTLSNGEAKVTLKKFKKPGKYTLTITWAGDTNATGGSATVKVKQLPKPKKHVKKK